jgi:hypothetical protein
MSLNNNYIILSLSVVLILLVFYYISEHFGCNTCGDILKHQWVKNEGDCNVLCNGNGCTIGIWENGNCTCE